jgi:homoserine dehydrogenase
LSAALRLGVAGLGTVGGGLLKLLAEQGKALTGRSGRKISVVAVAARDRKKDRGVDLSKVRWVDDPVALARDPEVDVVVELMGGSEDPAKALVEAALAARKPVVTANKALIAHHGVAIAKLSERHGTPLHFEASVAGGIPIIKALREGFAGNRVDSLYGILNGTCNYILTTMRETGRDFADVLAEAQKLGYAEADPGFDIDGIDTAHKLAILASVAFGVPVNIGAVHVDGIRNLSLDDIRFADELGYRIKLLAIARRTPHGLEQRVHPCMVPNNTPIAHVNGVFNAVVVEGSSVGRVMLEGRGAGAGPTASAVAADIVDIARGVSLPVFGVPTANLARLPAAPTRRHQGAYYIRLVVLDRPGVLADIAAALRDAKVSIESVIQRGRAPEEPVPLVLITHDTEEARMTRALERMVKLDTVTRPPTLIPIEQL